MKCYIITAAYGGVVNDVLLYFNKDKAEVILNRLRKQANIDDDDIELWEKEI